MQDYQQRVVDEKKELDDKIAKLGSFVVSIKFLDVSLAERDLMVDQLKVMQQYSDLLRVRIELFA